MTENGFYLIDDSYIDLIKRLGGRYNDNKARPMFCCVKDTETDGLYWLIPTSDYSHRPRKEIDRINSFLKEDSIREAYYHIGTTNKKAIYKISNALPVSEKYILREYLVRGTQLILKNDYQIREINRKLRRIISYEELHPNRFEQKITALREYICNELEAERKSKQLT